MTSTNGENPSGIADNLDRIEAALERSIKASESMIAIEQATQILIKELAAEIRESRK